MEGRIVCILATASLVWSCGSDAEPCPSIPAARVVVAHATDIDLLVVVDARDSMSEEIAWLGEEWPEVLRRVGTGDHDADGIAELPRPNSVNAGVVTADMGTGGWSSWESCLPEYQFGSDGVLQHGSPGPPECEGTYPTFVSYDPGEADEAARAVPCILRSLEPACEFPQPLEAMLKAVSASTDDTTFQLGTRGHADGANAGFLRPESLLAVILFRNADDCSVSEPGLFDPGAVDYSGEGTFRCAMNPEALLDPSLFGQRLARVGGVRSFFVGAVVGVPPDVSGRSLAEIAADPRMQATDSSASPGTIEPACSGPYGSAEPAPRMIGFLRNPPPQAHGRQGLVASICATPPADPFGELAEGISTTLGAACLPPDLPAGLEGCRLVEAHSGEGDWCSRPGVRNLAVRDGYQYCEIQRADRSGEIGWWLDAASEATGRLCPGRSSGRILLNGVAHEHDIRLECPDVPCATDTDCGGYAALGDDLRCHDGHCCRR